MALKARLRRLEAANTAENTKVEFITYGLDGDTKAEANAKWEAENRPLSECRAVFFTTFELKPV
jgi:hypothetical protein